MLCHERQQMLIIISKLWTGVIFCDDTLFDFKLCVWRLIYVFYYSLSLPPSLSLSTAIAQQSISCSFYHPVDHANDSHSQHISLHHTIVTIIIITLIFIIVTINVPNYTLAIILHSISTSQPTKNCVTSLDVSIFWPFFTWFIIRSIYIF